MKKRLVACGLIAGFCFLLFRVCPKHSPVIKGSLSASDISQIEKDANQQKRDAVWYMFKQDLAEKNFSHLGYYAKCLFLPGRQFIEVVSPGEIIVSWGSSPTNSLLEMSFLTEKIAFVTNN